MKFRRRSSRRNDGSRSRRPFVEGLEDRRFLAAALFAIPSGQGSVIAELDPQTGAELRRFAAPATIGAADGLAYNGESLFYMPGDGTRRLFELSPLDGAVLDLDVLPFLGSGSYDALAMLNGRVYVQDYSNNSLHVFDPLSDSVLNTLNVAADLIGGLTGAENPLELIAVAGSDAVRINPANGSITAGFSLGSSGYLGAAGLGDRLYFGSNAASQIRVTDRAGGLVTTLTTPYPFMALAGDDYHAERISNGGFETGLTDWLKSAEAGSFGPGFSAYSGANPASSGLPAPPSGANAAFNGDMLNGPGAYFLYRDITLPAAQSHDLSLTLYYNNSAAGFTAGNTLGFQAGPNQQIRIDVVHPTASLTSTAAGDVLANLFRTDPGEPNSLAPTTLSADLSPFAGETIRLRIALVANQAPMWLGVDSVSLLSRTSGLRETPPAIYLTQSDGTRLGSVHPEAALGIDRGAFGVNRTYATAFDNATGTLYAIVNSFSGNPALATVNTTTGAVAPIGSGLGHEVNSLEIDSAGRLFGVGRSNGMLYSIDRTSGVATIIANTGGSGWTDLAFNSADVLFGVDGGNQLWTINSTTAAITPVAPINGMTAQVTGLAFDAADTLYFTLFQPNSPLYTFDIPTTVSTFVGSTGLDLAVGGDIYTPPLPPPSGASVGVATDRDGRRVLIFDPATGDQTGVVAIPAAGNLGDIVLSPDGAMAYVADVGIGRVWFVDVVQQTLASGISSIYVDGPVSDLDVTPDGKFLIAVNPVMPISVIDTTTRTIVAGFPSASFSGVEIVSNTEALFSHVGSGWDIVDRFTIGAAGELTPQPPAVAGTGANVTLAPNGTTAIGIGSTGHFLQSFSFPGMSALDQESAPETVDSLVFHPDGTKFYVRGGSEVVGFHYNSATGVIGGRLFTTPINNPAGMPPGMERLDISPDGLRVYVVGLENVHALNSTTGAVIDAVFLENAVFTGVDILPGDPPEPPAPASIGVAVDYSGNKVLIFDPESDTQLGLIDLPGGGLMDVVVAPDRTTAYVSDVNQQAIWVVDLEQRALASGINPIPMGVTNFDLALTADGTFLLASSQPGSGLLQVIDTASRAIVSDLPQSGISGVELIGSDQVLIGRLSGNVVEHFTLNSAGALTSSGRPLITGGSFNLTAAPDGATAAGIDSGRFVLTTFRTQSMFEVQDFNPGYEMYSVVFNAEGTRIYLRTSFGVTAYHYDPIAATVGANVFQIPLNNFLGGPFGVEQLDLSPDGTKLFVGANDRLVVLNAETGAEMSDLPAAPATFAGVDVQAAPEEPPVSATLGAAIDVAGKNVLIFDGDTDTELALVPVPAAGGLLDVVVSPDTQFAFASDFNGQQIWVVDLTTRALAAGTNPIPVGYAVFDLDLTADGRFLVATNAPNQGPLKVIDTATRTIASTLFYGSINSVEVIGNDVVLISHGFSNSVERFTLTSTGQLGSPSLQLNGNGGGFNITAAPDGATAVGISSGRGTLTTFNVGSMSWIADYSPGPELVTTAFHPDGTKLYVRTTGGVLGYAYNPAAGIIGAELFHTPLINNVGAPYGVDQLDLSPDGTKLYVTTTDRIAILNPNTGAIVDELTSTGEVFAGIDLPAGEPIEPPGEADFGDAPTAAQSGFAMSYPTTLTQDGARHLAVGPTLGSGRDTEPDGQPTASLDQWRAPPSEGDAADEDGVVFLTSLVSTPTGTTGRVVVSLENAANAKLDAWIDFNRDGDWDDAGERIFADQLIFSGKNSLAIAVPADAATGVNFARFRVSSVGNLGPTGAAADGEVEDYPVQILAAGPRDTTLDSDGIVVSNLPDLGSGADVSTAIQPDQKLIVVGGWNDLGTRYFAIARYHQDGSVDATFDGDGRALVSFGVTNQEAHEVVVQPDGKIVVIGSARVGGVEVFAIARLNPDGSPDTSFDGDGQVTVAFGGQGDAAYDVALDANGKIVVAGISWNGTNYDLAVLRLLPNGALDGGFDGDGKVVLPIGSGDDLAYGVAIQSDGRIVVAGHASIGGNDDFALVRLNTDGSLDTSFDGDGKVLTSFSASFDNIHEVVLAADGGIIAAGSAGSDFALARYNSNGSLDTNFGGGDGKVTTNLIDIDIAYGVALQANGKIVVAGYQWNFGAPSDTAVVRYLPDGTLDLTFDDDGIFAADFGMFGNDGANDVAVQANGDIVVTGYLFSSNRDANTFLARFAGDPVATTYRVVSSAPTPNGFQFSLSGPAAIAGLSLYDYRDAGGVSVLGPADVQLTNGGGQSIPGSLIVGAGDDDFTFAATGGVLPPGVYTLTLRSASNGFRSLSGDLLDGDGDGLPGGHFVTTFQVTAPPANRVTVSLPNFARGPEQPVNVPADSPLGLPLMVSDAGPIRFLSAEVRFDPELFGVGGVTLPLDAPPGSTAGYTSFGSGRGLITLTFGGPWAVGSRPIAFLQAGVPAIAAERYGERALLDLSALDVRDVGNLVIASIDQDAVHVNAYSGDVGRNGRYDSFDVQQASRAALRLDTGFQQHPLLDPVIIADFNGNGRVDSFDVQRLSRLALRLPVAETPALPAPLPTVENTGRFVEEESPADPKPSGATSSHTATTGLRSDVDGNGAVDAQDVLWTIYYYRRSENGAIPRELAPRRVDINKDGRLDPADILFAITDLRQRENESEGERVAADTEDEDALTSLLAQDIFAARKKR